MPEFRVAVLLPMEIGYGRGVMQGIGQFVSEVNRDDKQVNWRVYRSEPSTRVLSMMKQWKPDGVIAHVADSELAKSLSRIKQPVVNTTSTVSEWTGALVEVDHDDIGRLAAEHFLSRGFRNFGYLGSESAGFSVSREAAFRREIAAAGYSVDSCYLNYLPWPPLDQPWNYIDKQLVGWIRRLDRPAAVLASNDRPARELADACQALKVDVPGEVAILGVDDDEYECFLGEPPISSIVNPSETIGLAACQLLADLMQRRSPKALRLALRARRVTVRQSSDAYAVDDVHLNQALTMIREDAVNGLTPAMIHDRVDCSRRLLERRFREFLGHGILEEIRNVRLRRAHQLLIETRLPIARVADLTGFAEPRTFSSHFKKHFGKTPRQVRRAD